MAIHYNTKLDTKDLIFYYDSNNIKSFANNGVLNSLVSSYPITTTSILNAGALVGKSA